jgi:hypothetical protein
MIEPSTVGGWARTDSVDGEHGEYQNAAEKKIFLDKKKYEERFMRKKSRSHLLCINGASTNQAITVESHLPLFFASMFGPLGLTQLVYALR